MLPVSLVSPLAHVLLLLLLLLLPPWFSLEATSIPLSFFLSFALLKVTFHMHNIPSDSPYLPILFAASYNLPECPCPNDILFPHSYFTGSCCPTTYLLSTFNNFISFSTATWVHLCLKTWEDPDSSTFTLTTCLTCQLSLTYFLTALTLLSPSLSSSLAG